MVYRGTSPYNTVAGSLDAPPRSIRPSSASESQDVVKISNDRDTYVMWHDGWDSWLVKGAGNDARHKEAAVVEMIGSFSFQMIGQAYVTLVNGVIVGTLPVAVQIGGARQAAKETAVVCIYSRASLPRVGPNAVGSDAGEGGG